MSTRPEIPIMESGPDFALASLVRFKPRTMALLDIASRRYPVSVLKTLDKVSRSWLSRWNNAHLGEIDRIAEILGRPGAYFFSVNYEWGCTCHVLPSPDGDSARLVRVLDWVTPGLGANLVAVKVTGNPGGPFALLTWPGYTGVLQVMAPGRFSASLNQAPMRRAVGLYYLDWAANRGRVWRMRHPTPAHLLRKVSEEAASFDEAVTWLSEAPISTPAIFSIAGINARETAIIERTETEANVRHGVHVAANHWETSGWRGQARGIDSGGRARLMSTIAPSLTTDFNWLVPPILNEHTRLVMVADARAGAYVAQGFEHDGAATAPLRLDWAGAALTAMGPDAG